MRFPLPAAAPPALRARTGVRQHLIVYAWRVYGALGIVVVGSFLFLSSSTVQNVLSTSATCSAALALTLATWLHCPRHGWVWALMAVGLGLAVGGDLIGVLYENMLQRAVPFPSVADALYLGSYFVFGLGVLYLTRMRTPAHDWNSVIDALIVVVGVGMVAWVFLMAPYVHDPSLSVVQRVVSIAYPLADLWTLLVAARLLLITGVRSFAYLCFSLGILCWLVADTAYGILVLHAAYATGSLVQVGWIVGYTCIGLAALHPSMHTPAPSRRRYLALVSGQRLGLLAGAALLAPTAMALQALLGQPIDVPVLVGGAVVLFGLVIVRMRGLMGHLATLVTREHVLRRAGGALVAATDRASLYTAAVEGAWMLAQPTPTVRATLALGAPAQMTVVAATGTDAHLALGQPIAAALFEGPLRDALAHHHAVRIDHLDPRHVHHALPFLPNARAICMTPLVIQGDVHGMLVLASETGLPDACQDALAALGIDVALALDSRALADAVHQHHSDARLAALVQHASDVLIVINAEGVVRYVSGSVTRIMGYTPAEVIDTLRPDLVHPEDLPVVQRHMATVLSTTGATPPLEVRMRHRDGRWVSLELIASNLLHVPQVEGLLLTCRDITERKVLEARLTHQAFHDALTNLPNRALFMDRVAHALRRAARHAQGVAVLFLDVDRFKTINDSLGHAAGDHLLRAVAERIHACVRPEDTLARLGGDEFTILLDNSADRAMATDVAERILTALQAPICINGHEIVISASIGIVCSGTESTTPDDLLRYADIAMYQAKSAGKGRYLVFDHAMNAHALERLELEHDLRRAIELDELRVYYQPIVDLRTAQMTGLEALARWQHPAHGLVAPAHFIPLAEETGLIVPLGRWVLETACRQVRHWQAHHPHARTLEVSVNLSARQFRDAQLVGDVAQILADTQLLPACLKLEITESVVMDVADAAAATLQELKALGIQLAIDDFGTGYSSLSYLKRFAVDTLKIDRAFVAGVGQDVEDTAIVRAVTTLAHSLGLSVTAEGVETAAVVAHLHALGCTAAQGYFFAKPLPSDAIPRLLDQISDPTVEAALPWRGPPHAGTPASSAVGTPCGAAVDNTVRSQPASTVERSRVLPAAECTDDPPAHHL